MQKRKQQLFALALALWAFSSCSQDARDAEVSTTGGQTVTFSLDAEVSVDDSELRAIEYKLGKNAKNQLVPLPQFTDKQEVEVHTILKSSNGSAVAKTLKWRYDASKKKLVLKQTDGHSITVSGFNNDSGVKWYISGLIGGALNGTKVEFMGSRVVKGVNGNAGDALGSMEVPYAFGWTELTINTSSPKDSEGSHKYAEVPASKNVKFQPLGSMLAVKLGTNQRAGAYTFTPKGFTLSSNAWGDQGSFELSTAIPPTDPHTALPTWTEGSCAGSMYYTFASGEEPGAIAHNQTTAKTYYVWVMPHKTLPTTADVRVMLKGTSSRPETETYKDYTNTWFTDYTTEGKATQGKVTQGRVHVLTAKASYRVALPIEYVTEYNLAGGEGLTDVLLPRKPGLQYDSGGFLDSPNIGGTQPPGVVGPLRFATSHRNDQSGYYNWYKAVGRYQYTYNPDAKNLQNEVDKTFGVGKYFIPTAEQLWGISRSGFTLNRHMRDLEMHFNADDAMSVGFGVDIFRQVYSSDYTGAYPDFIPFSDVSELPFGGTEPKRAVSYAIRFKARKSICSPVTSAWDYDDTGTRKSYTYTSALDNSMKCAYRFTRVGSMASWNGKEDANLGNHVIIDVVYLGEESIPTELATISDENWWSIKKSQGRVLSRTFPASGSLTEKGTGRYNGSVTSRDMTGEFLSVNRISVNLAWNMLLVDRHVPAGSTYAEEGLSVRLFKRLDL